MTTRVATPFWTSFRIQLDVIGALILRDLRTRFDGGMPAFLIAVLWPLAHIAIIVTAYRIAGAKDWLGSDPLVFIAIGVLQFILSLYILRWIGMAISDNRVLLRLPRVKTIDLVLARVVVELTTAFAVAFSCIATIILLGSQFAPADPLGFLEACGASLLLGVGLGIPAAVLVALRPRLILIVILLIVLSYFASGVLFLPATLPEQLRELISWSPLAHSVEWAREAYYADYRSPLLDKTYLIGWGLGGIMIGLAFERILRGRILQG